MIPLDHFLRAAGAGPGVALLLAVLWRSSEAQHMCSGLWELFDRTGLIFLNCNCLHNVYIVLGMVVHLDSLKSSGGYVQAKLQQQMQLHFT